MYANGTETNLKHNGNEKRLILYKRLGIAPYVLICVFTALLFALYALPTGLNGYPNVYSLIGEYFETFNFGAGSTNSDLGALLESLLESDLNSTINLYAVLLDYGWGWFCVLIGIPIVVIGIIKARCEKSKYSVMMSVNNSKRNGCDTLIVYIAVMGYTALYGIEFLILSNGGSNGNMFAGVNLFAIIVFVVAVLFLALTVTCWQVRKIYDKKYNFALLMAEQRLLAKKERDKFFETHAAPEQPVKKSRREWARYRGRVNNYMRGKEKEPSSFYVWWFAYMPFVAAAMAIIIFFSVVLPVVILGNVSGFKNIDINLGDDSTQVLELLDEPDEKAGNIWYYYRNKEQMLVKFNDEKVISVTIEPLEVDSSAMRLTKLEVFPQRECYIDQREGGVFTRDGEQLYYRANFNGKRYVEAYITLPEGSDSSIEWDEYGYHYSANMGDNLIGGIDQFGNWEFTNKHLSNIVLPNNITGIANDAFWDCSDLTSIEIPEGTETIGVKAFYHCESLNSVSLPQSLKNIGSNAFAYCESLKNIEIPDGVETIGENAFFKCKLLPSIEIPDSVETIGESAFSECESLKSVSLSKNLKEIAEDVFFNCESLNGIEIPDGVTTIGNRAFSGCVSLGKISLPQSLNRIGERAFWQCISLKDIEISDSVKTIGKYAFSGCELLATVDLPNGLEIIDKGLFSECRSLVEIELPNSVTRIYQSAFANCDSLTDICLSESLTDIGIEAFEGCSQLKYNILDNSSYLGTAENKYYALAKASVGNTAITLAAETKLICPNAFAECSLQTITLSAKTVYFSEGSFAGTSATVEWNKESNITEITARAFQGYEGTSITIPATISVIRVGAFKNCLNLKSVIFEDVDGWRIALGYEGMYMYSRDLQTPSKAASLLVFYSSYEWLKKKAE